MPDKWGAVCVVLLVIFIPIVAWMSGYTIAQREMKREAVRQGVAEWRPDEDGNAEFHWKSLRAEDGKAE